jgi:hypothetical protein
MTKHEITEKLDEISRSIHTKNMQNQAKLEKLLFSLYNNESQKIVRMVTSGEADFTDLKAITDSIEIVRKKLTDEASTEIIKSIDKSVKLGMSSVKGQINVFKSILPEHIVETEVSTAVFNQVAFDAAEAMSKLVDGLTVSDKIWNTNLTSLDQLRAYLMQSMIDEVDFSEVYQQIKSFLVLPDVDLRTKKWLEFFRNNPPGKGIYRSAWKNVLRLIRTETNRAFREALKQYTIGKEWVQGIKWTLSDAHPEFDICDFYANDDSGLGPGIYTSETVPDSHPHCICYLVLVPNYEFLGVQF